MVTIIHGDALQVLQGLPAESVHCCVTSPPYWGLRDYGVTGQIGLERTLSEYVSRMVDVFGEVRRVLRGDGTLWLNLGDSYGRAASKGQHRPGDSGKQAYIYDTGGGRASSGGIGNGIKVKDLIGIPWTVAFALRSDGWFFRSDIIWNKRACLPESVTDRPTKSHEYLFLLSKSERYYYDHKAILEPYEYSRDHYRNIDNPPKSYVPGSPVHTGLRRSGNQQRKHGEAVSRAGSRLGRSIPWVEGHGRNKRSVWTLNPEPFPGAHFAVMPTKLVEPCVLAGCPPGGTVLDPFGGSGTVGLVAEQNGRDSILIELNHDYCEMARRRTAQRGIF